MSIKIALAGNPNCGKTTMFNDLTGSSQYVGNWPGVTVEKKEGKLKGHKDVTVVDLPGIYSLSPYTLEEVVTRDFLLNEKPDVIINIVDASNLERNLYLTTQLVEIGIPVIIALNMMDIVRKNGDKINVEKLSAALGCEIIETSAVKNIGSREAANRAVELASAGAKTVPMHSFDEDVEKAIKEIQGLLTLENSRWYAIKLFERDEKVLESVKLSADTKAKIEKIAADCEKVLDDDCESIITNQRYEYIGGLVKGCAVRKRIGMTVSDKIDRIVTNRILGLPIFALVMWGVYYIAVSSLGAIATDWINDTFFGEIVMSNVQGWLEGIGTQDWLISLVVDGIIGGVGAVLGFVPQIMILFFLLSILEDCGYMARVAFIMDRIFRKFGLSGKSFIPMLISSGCGVPGIMASRTIEQERDRKMTIMLTTFIPCGAKLPIFAMIAGALFGGASWVAPSMYFIGIIMVILCGIFLKKTALFNGDPAPFVMELPQYHLPAPKGVLIHMWDRGKSFIIKAGTIIFVACAFIWFFSSFGWADGSFGMVDGPDSMLAKIGGFVSPIFAPLGFGNWQASAAAITGLVAKENIVATFGIFNGLSDVAEDDPSLLGSVAALFTPVSAYAYMAFNLLCAPCFAAIGAIRREMGTAKWTWITILFQTLTAWVVALVINQVGSAIFLGGSVVAAIVTVVCVAALVAAILLISKKTLTKNELQGARN